MKIVFQAKLTLPLMFEFQPYKIITRVEDHLSKHCLKFLI